MSAQRTANQTCSIELCLSATSFVACGAGVELTTGVYFRLPCRHPSILALDAHVECVGAGGFWSAPHNL